MGLGWFVLVEESELTGGDFHYRVTDTVPGGNSADEARAKAMRMARTKKAVEGTREIYRAPDGSLHVVFKRASGLPDEDFRLSVLELVEAHEPPEEEKKPDGKRGRFRR